MDIKSVVVTGGKGVFNPIIDDANGEKKRSRQTRKRPVSYHVTGKLDEHGEMVGPEGGAQIPAAPPASAALTEIKKVSVKAAHEAPVSGGGSANAINATATPAPSPVPTALSTKVLLGGKKPHRVKVLLTKKRHGPPALAGPEQPRTSHHKPARKIQLGVSAIKKTVRRAKRITRSAKTLPIETIRAELVKAGIIKEGSKAPEGVMRQMYADAKTVSTRSL
jgi:hypothetical protein